MLHLIGLGLEDHTDVTVKGLEAIRKSTYVYLEGYTSLLQVPVEQLEEFYQKNITVLDRQGVEITIENVLEQATQTDVSLLVVGDVFSATTHSDLYLRAHELGVPVKVIHNASILNAIGACGIDLYKFGRTTTLVYPEGSFRPTSFYDVIIENHKRGLHTLCLLDIKADQHRYMSVNEAIQLLLDIESQREETIIQTTKLVGCARIGCSTQHIRYGNVQELLNMNFGREPHTLIVPGKLHEIEEEMLQQWNNN